MFVGCNAQRRKTKRTQLFACIWHSVPSLYSKRHFVQWAPQVLSQLTIMSWSIHVYGHYVRTKLPFQFISDPSVRGPTRLARDPRPGRGTTHVVAAPPYTRGRRFLIWSRVLHKVIWLAVATSGSTLFFETRLWDLQFCALKNATDIPTRVQNFFFFFSSKLGEIGGGLMIWCNGREKESSSSEAVVPSCLF